MSIYDFVDRCREEGIDAEEAAMRYEEALEEERESFLETYENDPWVQEGWHQQDVIDMYRRER